MATRYESDSTKMNLFAYGTLMDAEIMEQVAGARYRSRKATLPHYARKTVLGEVYPAVIKQNGGSVDGIIYFDVSAEAFDRLDKFEGSLYVRIEAETVGNDGERVSVCTYAIDEKFANKLSNEEWSYESFLSKHKQHFQRDYQGYSNFD